METSIKDAAQVSAWLVAAVGGTIAGFKAVAELRSANRERAKEFRWRQAEMARTLLDQLWAEPLARAAMKMLDWDGLEYTHDNRRTGKITRELLEAALRTTNTQFNPDERFVRDAFDEYFDGIDRIEHYLRIGLVNFEDVQGRLEYHVGLLAKWKAPIESFLQTYGFAKTREFLERFGRWSGTRGN